ncbi:MAG TPA: hypothetical protein VIF37_09195 [Methylobacter sp.]
MAIAGLPFVTPFCFADSPIVPDAQKTPGDVLMTDAKVICVSGYTKKVRDVPQAVKEQAYRIYGITARKPGEYEVDHLISLELGGSNSIRNLWPESFITQPLNAHVKDKLENKLHDLICSGQLPVQQAQQEITHDWIAAYKKYVGPLASDAQTPVTEKSSIVDERPLELSNQFGSLPDQPDEAGNCPSSSPIKVSKNGIYHVLGDPNYEHTKAKSCFPTPEAAKAAGFRAPKR